MKKITEFKQMGSENVGHVNLKFTNLKCKMKVREFNTLKGDHISEKAGKTCYVPCFYDPCTYQKIRLTAYLQRILTPAPTPKPIKRLILK